MKLGRRGGVMFLGEPVMVTSTRDVFYSVISIESFHMERKILCPSSKELPSPVQSFFIIIGFYFLYSCAVHMLNAGKW